MPPAARLGDPHTCPLTTGLVAHVGGPITAGSPNVLIEGRPAARQTDACLCTGPVDLIVAGSPTVLINGLPAARLGDPSAHGGMIVAGAGSVQIG